MQISGEDIDSRSLDIDLNSSRKETTNMAKDRKLKAALDRHKGVDYKLEHQKKKQKQAEKKRRGNEENEENDEVAIDVVGSDADEADEEKIRAEVAEQLKREEFAADAAEERDAVDGEVEGWETDESEDGADEDEEDGGVDLNGLEDESESDSEDEDMEANDNAALGASREDPTEDEAEEDIPLSDIASLASEDKGDIIPHQRLTINNTSALLRSLKSISLPSSLPFSAIQSVTSAEPVHITDPEDDLTRELAFYKQSLDAVKEARDRLKKEGVPFARPADFFAEMVKSEEQMGKVRSKQLDEAARKKASADARRQRDLKKFGKAVQVAKLQERDRAKRETLEKINVLKRSKWSCLSFVGLSLMLRRTPRCRSSSKRRRHVRCRAGGRRRHCKGRSSCSETWRSWSWAEQEAAEERREVWFRREEAVREE